MNRKSSSLKLTLTAVFAALMIAGTYIRIPLGPVPIVLTTIFTIGAGAILGPLAGAGAVLLYLILGAIGLPVFSAGGGLALFLSPTGGFLMGYLLSALFAGLIIHTGTPSRLKDVLGILAGTIIIYLPGIPFLAYKLEITIGETLKIGFYPFIIGDLIKAAVLFLLLDRLRKSAPEFFVK
ncbi:MAG: biotin transporter BioY [Spirochaetales bacterium]|nr:biotin transporter BioY [Spirochaetales bacterium]